MIGGPGTPGVLVARRELFTNRVPDVPGGGRSRTSTRPSTIITAPSSTARKAAPLRSSSRSGPDWCSNSRRPSVSRRSPRGARLRHAGPSTRGRPNPNIVGAGEPRRRTAVDRVVRGPPRTDGSYLHHNYVVALLNDLFGIQSRGGCSCAGPYGHRLLGHRPRPIARVPARDRPRVRGHQARLGAGELQLLHRRGGVSVHRRCRPPRRRPGCEPVADYRFEPDSGLWHHREARTDPPMSLADISYADGEMRYENRRPTRPTRPRALLARPTRLCDAAGTSRRPHAAARRRRPTSNTCVGFRTRARWAPDPRLAVTSCRQSRSRIGAHSSSWRSTSS